MNGALTGGAGKGGKRARELRGLLLCCARAGKDGGTADLCAGRWPGSGCGVVAA